MYGERFWADPISEWMNELTLDWRTLIQSTSKIPIPIHYTIYFESKYYAKIGAIKIIY